MPLYEYRSLTLRAEGPKEHCYAWHCSVCGRLGDFDCLTEYLNEYGKQGWQVVTHVSDGRFGNVVVLQRSLDGALEEKVTPSVVSPTPTSDPGGMIAASLDAYTSVLQAQLAKRDQEFTVILELLSQQLQGGFSQALNSVATKLDMPVAVQLQVDDRSFQRSCSQLIEALAPKPVPVKQHFLLQALSTVKNYFRVRQPQVVLD